MHGNAEDILTSKEITDYLKLYLEVRIYYIIYLKMDILAVEYPGYSIYKGIPNEE